MDKAERSGLVAAVVAMPYKDRHDFWQELKDYNLSPQQVCVCVSFLPSVALSFWALLQRITLFALANNMQCTTLPSLYPEETTNSCTGGRYRVY